MTIDYTPNKEFPISNYAIEMQENLFICHRLNSFWFKQALLYYRTQVYPVRQWKTNSTTSPP